jgi:hypothetical protein
MRYSEFSAAALGAASVAAAKGSRVLLPGVDGPVQAFNKIFAFQSYFDSTLLQKAILTQSPTDAIVQSTQDEPQTSGYGLALSPASQTPVAVQFRVGSGQASNSLTQIMRPGDVIWPIGERGKAFSSFRWGLPFGWLGGGMATIYVLPTPDAALMWSANTEVIFHRARYEIKQPSDLTAAGSYNNAPKNWPMRFPWTQALRGSSSINQIGRPALAIANPSRILVALRNVTTAAAGSGPRVRVIMQSTNEVGLDSTGAVVATNPIFDEIAFPEWSSVGTDGNLATQNPAVMYTGLLARVAADDGGVLFVDVSGTAATLNGGYVDVVRYGFL